MLGQMMDMPLTISALLVHADRNHGDSEIVSRTVEGPIHRYTYREAHRRSRQLANALGKFGLAHGDRVATLAWNGFRHLELYYAVSGSGQVIHTINPRLHADQLAWIANHAEDQCIFFDISFASLIEQIAPHCPTVKRWIAMTDRAHMPSINIEGLLCYEELVEAESDAFEWPLFDEKSAACLCYTSGTTGNPKGVLYSHRSTILHAMAAAQPDALNISSRDVILPVVPMFHVSAWTIPYIAAMVGSKLVMPGSALDGASLCELFEAEKVTYSSGVPTVWVSVLQHLRSTGKKPTTLNRMMVGGSAVPPSMMREFFEEYGIVMLHGWGMTETSPLGCLGSLKGKHDQLSVDEQFSIRVKQGRNPFGIDMKIVDSNGNDLPRDGKASGDLFVRGHWVMDGYFKLDTSPLMDGWFPTGDVATIDPDGYMHITDRTKDVIKSGGEWISSIDLENVAMAHPAVQMAAVIGVAHPKWDERPLLVVVKNPGHEISAKDLIAFYEGKIAKWWTPYDVRFVEELPLGATGKVQKNKLREIFSDFKFASA